MQVKEKLPMMSSFTIKYIFIIFTVYNLVSYLATIELDYSEEVFSSHNLAEGLLCCIGMA